jgi:polygalacturonase
MSHFKQTLLLCTLLFFANSAISSDRAVFDILDYGAHPDGETLSTSAIQSAINACYEAGGGEVLIPQGKFLTGTIVLKDNVFLNLDPMAVLLGSKNIDDYDPGYLIYA